MSKYSDTPSYKHRPVGLDGWGTVISFVLGALSVGAAWLVFDLLAGGIDQTTALYLAVFAAFIMSAVLIYTNFEAGERFAHRRKQTLVKLEMAAREADRKSHHVDELVDALKKKDG